VRDGIEAKQCVGPDGLETSVLIRSVERREKERAMHERFARRIEAGLDRLGRAFATRAARSTCAGWSASWGACSNATSAPRVAT